jgi:secretion/DNA translocation related TadE-like protein
VTGSTSTRATCTERGAAAVLATALAVLLVAVIGVASALAGLLVADRKASAAADLAALAAAGAIQQGRDPCRAAGRVAAANGARLRACRVRGEDVSVEAVREVTLLGHAVGVPGRARAGPATGSRAPPAPRAASAQQRLEQHHPALLVERMVAVPALG